MTYFGYSPTNPYHISVGVLLRNKQGQIAVHHFLEHKRHIINAYLLMRETIEPHESIEQALDRGLREEFGATGKMARYLGSIVSHFPMNTTDKTVQKTTLYFLFDLEHLGPRPEDDEESDSILEWHKPEFLIPVMKEQGKRLQREDADESEVLERLLALEK